MVELYLPHLLRILGPNSLWPIVLIPGPRGAFSFLASPRWPVAIGLQPRGRFEPFHFSVCGIVVPLVVDGGWWLFGLDNASSPVSTMSRDQAPTIFTCGFLFHVGFTT